MANFGGKLFAGRLFAGLLFGPDDEADADDEAVAGSHGAHRRRSWRPLPVTPLEPPPPRKRPRKRRQADILFLGH